MELLTFRGRELPIEALLQELHDVPANGATALVGVDGRAGAGKSSLCAAIANLDPSLAVVHTDEFYVPLELRRAPDDEYGRQIDWRRGLEDVVTPLFEGRPAHFQGFDWETQGPKDWRDVRPSGLVLLDGTYSTREELAPFLSLAVWLEVPRDLGLQRGIERDGPESEEWWMSDWVEDEDRYVLLEDPAQRADVVIDGSVQPDLYARGVYRRIR